MTKFDAQLPALATAAFTGLIMIAATETALAKSARCFTSDDGHYKCQFRTTDRDGSFEITGRGKPKFILIMDSPGVASGFANYGTGRNVSLPGQFIHQKKARACWKNTATKSRICAW